MDPFRTFEFMKLIQVDYSNRVYGLDFFRATAIILVVLGHGSFLAGNLFSFLPSIPLIDGVELFFVLSGFLIGSMLIKNIEKTEKFGASELFTFLKRRWFRTLPNYYLILGVNVLLVKFAIISGDLKQCTWEFLFFLQNFATGFTDFFWESWSLSIEEWFYIFLPVFLFIFLRFIPKRTAILLSILLLLVVPVIYRISISEQEVDGFWWDVHFRKVVLTRLDAIGYGVLMAYVKFYHGSFFSKARNWLFLLGLALIYLNIYLPKQPNDFYSKTFYFCVTSFGASLLLAKADSIKNFRFQAIGRFVTYISVISYAMYLVNLSLVASVFAKNFIPDRRLENALYYSLFWFFTLFISTLIYKFYEKPITDLRDKL